MNKRDASVTSAEQIFELATQPGIKVVRVKDLAEATYLQTFVMLKTLNTFRPVKGKNNTVILATGGSWEPARFLFGNPELSHRLLGMRLPLDRGLSFTCLDEYGYPKSRLDELNSLTGGRTAFLKGKKLPFLYGDIHRLSLNYAGFGEDDYLFPPVGFTGSGYSEGEKWRVALASRMYPAVFAAHGVGSYPHHDGFNDFSGFETPTGLMEIAGGTKLQNGNDIVAPGQSEMSLIFRNIAAAFGLSSIDAVFQKADELKALFAATGKAPDELSYFVGDEFTAFLDGLEQHKETALRVTGLMPDVVISQGLKDLRSGGEAGLSADIHGFIVSGGQKAPAFHNCFELPASEANPASAANFYGRVTVFVDNKAAHFARHEEWMWRFAPDRATRSWIEANFSANVIAGKFWAYMASHPERERWPD